MIIRTRLCIHPVAEQLAHPGVDDREAGAARRPRARTGARAAASVSTGIASIFAVQVAPRASPDGGTARRRRTRATPARCGTRRGPASGRGRRAAGAGGPRPSAARPTCGWCRRSAGTLRCVGVVDRGARRRTCAQRRVPRRLASPAAPRCRRAGGSRQRVVGDVRRADPGHVRRADRPLPPRRPPRAGERREHGVPAAVRLRHRARVRRRRAMPDADSRRPPARRRSATSASRRRPYGA